MKYNLIGAFVVFFLCFISCKDKDTAMKFVEEWEGKEIKFPKNLIFTKSGHEITNKVILNTEYKIVTYTDSIGCASCKLRLLHWKEFINQMDSLELDVPVLFFLHPYSTRELKAIMKRDKFDYPICLDEKDEFNKLNNFPSDPRFQTFLLNKDNRVIAVGSPVYSSKMKEFYLDALLSRKEKNTANNYRTKIDFDSSTVNLGTFQWLQKRDTVFVIKNTGNNKLVISDVITSCGCTITKYDKKPIDPGHKFELKISFKAESPEFFTKTINVYCNADSSPIQIKIIGKAE